MRFKEIDKDPLGDWEKKDWKYCVASIGRSHSNLRIETNECFPKMESLICFYPGTEAYSLWIRANHCIRIWNIWN